MRCKHFVLGTAFALGAAAILPSAASAQDSVYVPLMTYRTGPFSASGTPIANGMVDYLNMINARDGGVGGVKIKVEECETGYDTAKGVQCYESAKSKSPLVTTPYSTAITLQVIPKAGVDKVPILSMAYGLSAAADGNVFPWVFNPPSTYWDGASIFVKYVADQMGGLDKLKGKTIGLVYLDAPYGKEPIPLLQELAKDYGFTLKLYPVPAPDMQNQSALWLGIRRDRPDWIYMQGFGAMNPTAVKEAARINFPMDHLIGNWWAGGESDARPAGDGGKGYLSLDFNLVGQNFPVMQDIIKYVVDKGGSQLASKANVGENFYGRGVLNSMIIVEGIRNAQKLTGKRVITGEDMRRGLESLNVDDARLQQLGMTGFARPFRVSCSDHSGHHAAYIAKWDGSTWVKASDWIEPMKDKVLPLIESAAKQYATSNTGWPKRTEACDKSS